MQTNNSLQLFEKAKHFIPGGVNSPVRAFKAVGGNPLFIKSAKGAYLYDEDGNKYLDLINSWGPMILGHAHPDIEEAVKKAVEGSLSFGAPTRREVEIAELITEMVPSIEKVRMVNSGTEATMSAIRLARGYTGKDKIIKFEGCYHGHGDSFLIAAGSGAATFGEPNSPGVTKGTAKDTLLAPFNDLEKVKELMAANKNEIAAVILEPVPGNMGLIIPENTFMQGLRQLCDQENALLIFDEVMTGFRLSRSGAQGVLEITPDLTTLGKIIGGGMPVGAYGGRKEIMDFVSPQGPVYQAGTLSGNPVAMAAGYVMLQKLNEDSEIYTRLEQITTKIVEGIRSAMKKQGLNYYTTRIGSMWSLFFSNKEVKDFEGAKVCDTKLFGRFFHKMLEKGVYLAPSQFESHFISAAITDIEADHIVKAAEEALVEIQA